MIRLIIGIIIGAAIVTFAAQNAEIVEYTFLAWRISAPQAVIVVGVFLFGLLTGWLVTGLRRLRRRR